MPDALMLFAAGFGTRMGDLTRNRPKPLIEVAGRPLIDHALALAEGTGLARIVVNAHYLADQITAHLKDRPVQVTVEAPQVLDTGGGLKAALPLLVGDTHPAPVFTLNSDAVWTGANPLQTLANAWDGTRMGALLLLVPADRARGHKGAGDFAMADDGRLTRGPGLVYTGTQIIDTALLGDTPEGPFSLNLIWSRLASAGRLYGAVHPGGWCDVGHPGGIPLAEALLDTAG
ncbi:MAG: nucleotidyltransferase family protein [Qingshengfaniella sp.]